MKDIKLKKLTKLINVAMTAELKTTNLEKILKAVWNELSEGKEYK